MPARIQMRRTAGWRLPDGAISVARPTRWGNPYKVGTRDCLKLVGSFDGDVGHYRAGAPLWHDTGLPDFPLTAELAVYAYRQELEFALTYDEDGLRLGDEHDRRRVDELRAALEQLRGHDLACWCPLDQPCHADVLLDLANRPRRRQR